MHWAKRYSGIASLDVAKSLRNLVLVFDYMPLFEASYFPEAFPRLETLTVLLHGYQGHTYYPLQDPNHHYVQTPYGPVDIGELAPEVDGELNMSNTSSQSLAQFERFRSRINDKLDKGNGECPDWKIPELKLRLLKQYMANKGVTTRAAWGY